MLKKIVLIVFGVLAVCIFYFGGSFVYWSGRSFIHPLGIIDMRKEMGKMTTDELIQKVHSYDPFSPIPSIAIQTLSKRKNKKAIPILQEMTKSIHPDRRKEAIWALKEIESGK